MKKVLITTSGIGNRLGDFTKHTNKSLVSVGDKPTISRIIESYPESMQFVITLGYLGNVVQEFLELAYPFRNFEFINVDNYEGLGSSLGYSMLKAEPLLREPFIFHASDTLVTEKIPRENINWLGGYSGSNASDYTSFDCAGDTVLKTHSKGMDKFDYIYIGLAGIESFEIFWDCLRKAYSSSTTDTSLNDVRAIQMMIDAGNIFHIREFNSWKDVGNIGGLLEARSNNKRNLLTLEKNNEEIYKIGDSVIKYFADSDICARRIERSKVLASSVPEITSFQPHFYKYEFVEGTPVAEILTEHIFKELLEWANRNIWTRECKEYEKSTFESKCKEFYFDKTRQRVEDFFLKTGHRDASQKINGQSIPSTKELIILVEKEKLEKGHQSLIHGDFILDNIVKMQNDFISLDWRQDFSGIIETGDLYYDLAKLNHSLTMNHKMLVEGGYSFKYSENEILADVKKSSESIRCTKVLTEFIEKSNLSLRKVQLITALIWINMSALHPHPLDNFLYFYGKISLWNVLKEENRE